MFGFLLVLLFVWLGVAFLGAVVQGWLWLTLVAMPLLLVTGALAEDCGARRHGGGRSPAASAGGVRPGRT